ncbi:MAG: hypothetical protein KVP17_000826 [Porospora cf. gigantea B]|uniref:uncharacterized protein n=1 Tax=Porospora cf. gigantea B TaxID=2853592 RepID=UPI00357191E6|nr:MAG: hypothetical protein KVP17_000826 [Porospora cf. gigantea B]
MHLLGNKWFRLAEWTFTIFLTSIVYYGWQPWSLMLMRSGAYEWLCDTDVPPIDDNYRCEAQYDAVGSLYTLATSSEFIFGIFAGWLFDNVGPRLTAIVGEVLFFAGYVMILTSSSALPMYIPGHICAGAAVNLIAYPSFILAEIWPNRSQTLISVTLAVQVGATIIAPMMELVQVSSGWDFQVILGTYLAFCVPFVILYWLSLPRNRVLMRAEIAEATGAVYDQQAEKERDSGWHGYFNSMMTLEYVGVLIWYTASIMMYNSYTVRLRSHSGDAVANFMGWIMPAQGVLAVVFGFLNDKVITIWIILGITVGNILFLLIGFIPSTVAQYIGVVLYVITNSYIYTTKYTYTAELFPPEHFGKLAGTIGFASGWLQMFNILIDKSGAAYSSLFTGWVIASAVLCGVLGWFLFRQVKRGITYKTSVNDVETSVLASSESTSTAGSRKRRGSKSTSVTSSVPTSTLSSS